MSVSEPKSLITYITNWVASYAKEHGKSSFIIRKNCNYEKLLYEICSKAAIQCEGAAFVLDPYGPIFQLASDNNGLVVSSLNANNTYYARTYGKYFDGLADIFPFFHLYSSELQYLSRYLFPELICSKDKDQDIIEQVLKINNRTKILDKYTKPEEDSLWYMYTMEQKRVISYLWHRNKTTQHKSLNDKPACPVNCLVGILYRFQSESNIDV